MFKVHNLLVLTFSALICSTSFAQEGSSKQIDEPNTEKMQMKVAEPSEDHAVIFQDVGTWDCAIKIFMGPEPTITKGVEVNQKVGLFWMTSNFKYDLNGTAMHGQGQFAYNAATKKYHGTWIDSASDALTMMDGSYDKATKTMTWNMKSNDPAGEEVDMQIIDKKTSDKTRDFQMLMKTPNAKEFIPIMTMELTKRAKKSPMGSAQPGFNKK